MIELKKHVFQHLNKDIQKIALKIRDNAVKVIDEEALTAWGYLRNGIKTEVVLTDKEQVIKVYVHNPDEPDMKYAQYIHEGIRPHMPPVDKIKAWVIKKGIHQSSLKEAWTNERKKPKKNRRLKSDLEDRAVESVAWAIAINMKKRGKKAVPFLNLAIKMTLDNMR